MLVLDLHGIRYAQVERMVENFVLLEELPLKIITGNSVSMRSIVCEVVERHSLSWHYESDWNLGSIIVS